MNFKLQSEYQPTGDQPQAIQKLVHGLENGEKYQTLLGVTGSGKTFTIANVVNEIQKPTLVLAHNKTPFPSTYAHLPSSLNPSSIPFDKTTSYTAPLAAFAVVAFVIVLTDAPV